MEDPVIPRAALICSQQWQHPVTALKLKEWENCPDNSCMQSKIICMTSFTVWKAGSLHSEFVQIHLPWISSAPYSPELQSHSRASQLVVAGGGGGWWGLHSVQGGKYTWNALTVRLCGKATQLAVTRALCCSWEMPVNNQHCSFLGLPFPTSTSLDSH